LLEVEAMSKSGLDPISRHESCAAASRDPEGREGRVQEARSEVATTDLERGSFDPVTDMASDRHGRPVNIGTTVRIVELAAFLKRDLPPDEWARLAGMVGRIFEVSEIDENGTAWIEQWFDDPDGGRVSHSVALEAHEMEVV
jgi:hypothetical protein